MRLIVFELKWQWFTDDQDVVELLHAVNLGQKLVDHSVMHSRATCAGASLLADGIQLIENDNVEAAVCSQLEAGQVLNVEILFVLWVNIYKGRHERFSPSSAPPLPRRTVCGCWPRTLPRTCWGSQGRWQLWAHGRWASCQSAWPSVFYHSLEVQKARCPSRAYTLKQRKQRGTGERGSQSEDDWMSCFEIVLCAQSQREKNRLIKWIIKPVNIVCACVCIWITAYVTVANPVSPLVLVNITCGYCRKHTGCKIACKVK